jgi:hypothetical protein
VTKVSNVSVTSPAVIGNKNRSAPGGVNVVMRRENGGGGDVRGAGSTGGEGGEVEVEGRDVEGGTDDSAGHAKTSGHNALSVSVAESSSSSVEVVRDYSGFAALQGLPRVGDMLAFKVTACNNVQCVMHFL